MKGLRVSFSGWVYIDFNVIRKETEKSFTIIAADGKIYSLPKNQISRPKDYKAGDRNGCIGITEWLAVKRGWISETY